MDLWRKGTGIDLLTVTMALKQKGELDGVGGAYALSCMTNRVAQTCNLEYHCAILRQLASLRKLRTTGMELAGNSDITANPHELLSMLNTSVEGLAITDDGADLNAAEVAMALMDTDQRPQPIYMGIANLDNIVFILPGNLITIRGEAGSGKTALLLTAILNLLDRFKVWFVSLEMPATEVMTRALCQLSQVDLDKAITGNLSPEEKERMGMAATMNAGVLSNLLIDDSGTMNIDVFKARAE